MNEKGLSMNEKRSLTYSEACKLAEIMERVASKDGRQGFAAIVCVDTLASDGLPGYRVDWVL